MGKMYSIARLIMNLIYDTMEISRKNYPLKYFNNKKGPSSKCISFHFTNRSLLKLKLLFLQCDLYNVFYLNILREIKIFLDQYLICMKCYLVISSNVVIHKIRGNQRQTDHHTDRQRTS